MAPHPDLFIIYWSTEKYLCAKIGVFIKKMHNNKLAYPLCYNSEKANKTKHSKQNYPASVTSYDTLPGGNEMGLFHNARRQAHTRTV